MDYLLSIEMLYKMGFNLHLVDTYCWKRKKEGRETHLLGYFVYHETESRLKSFKHSYVFISFLAFGLLRMF